MTGRICVCLIAAFIEPGGFPALAVAQATTATTGGTVLDETGAVVPGVLITVVNLGTAIPRPATTGPQGSLSYLQSRSWRPEFIMHGFRRANATRIKADIRYDRRQFRLRIQGRRQGH